MIETQIKQDLPLSFMRSVPDALLHCMRQRLDTDYKIIVAARQGGGYAFKEERTAYYESLL